MTSPAVEQDDLPDRDKIPDWAADTAIAEWTQTLPAGTRLRDYEVRSVLAESAYGVVYLAWDHSLQRPVAIREYLPRILASRSHDGAGVEVHEGSGERYAAGLKAFVAEARVLARFDHPALVKVYRFWEENGTAYMAMPHCEGPTLRRALAEANRPQDEAEVRTWLRPIVDALDLMHAAHCQHLDIGPDSIVLTPGGPVLLGFAAARRLLVGASDGPAATIKPGYAAIEQYGDAAAKAIGPWTDLYALAAVVYRAIGGREPVAAPQRVAHDPQPPLAALAAGRGSVGFLEAIDATLAVQPEHRPRSDAEFRDLVGAMEAPLPTLPMGRPRDLMAEPFEREDDAAREVTVPMPTQPYPPPVAGDDPMLRPFVMPEPQVPAVLPFAREDFRLSRKAMIGIVAGVAILGSLAAAGLRHYAAGPRAVGAAAVAPSTVAGRGTPTPTSSPPPAPNASPAPPASPAPTGMSAATASPAPTASPGSTAALPSPAPLAQIRSDAATAPQAGLARRISVENPPADAAARRALCGDLMQEATLRRLAPDEAAFYKTECR